MALVIGVPMDFRLGFGGSFGEETQIVVIDSAPPERPHPRPVAAELYGGVAATLDALRRRARRWPRALRLGRASCARSRTRGAPGEQAELDG